MLASLEYRGPVRSRQYAALAKARWDPVSEAIPACFSRRRWGNFVRVAKRRPAKQACYLLAVEAGGMEEYLLKLEEAKDAIFY